MIKLGRYELVKRLARGGMAELLLARQAGPEGFEKLLVIKRLLQSLTDQDDIIRMFLNEARIAARLTHPNIVQIFDLGKTDSEYFIAMEYVRGRDLRAIQKAADKQKHPIPHELSTYVLSCVCRGLHHAHTLRDNNGERLGIVHRDVSPHNVLISFSGDVKLADFGIAKATALAAETQAGVLKGKFAYMSPEQIRGEELDSRSDIFSAGILLHEIVCWQRLFRRESDFATIRAVESDSIPPPSALRDDVPDMLERVIMKALERDRDRRYETAQEMQMDLEAVISELGWRCGPVELASFLTSLFWRRITDQVAVGTGLQHGRQPAVAGPIVEPIVRRPSAPAVDLSAGSGQSGRPVTISADSAPRTQTVPSSSGEAPTTFSGAPTNPVIPAADEHVRTKTPAPAMADNFLSAEDAPPTIIQPPDFDDLLPAMEEIRDAGEGAQAARPPDTPFGLDTHAPLPVEPADLAFPTILSEQNGLVLGPEHYLPPTEEQQNDRSLHILLVVGIVLTLSLTVAILVLIALTHSAT